MTTSPSPAVVQEYLNDLEAQSNPLIKYKDPNCMFDCCIEEAASNPCSDSICSSSRMDDLILDKNHF
jgi:hypothetical protein